MKNNLRDTMAFIIMLLTTVPTLLINIILQNSRAAFFLVALFLAFQFFYALKPRTSRFFVKNALKSFFQDMNRLDIYRAIIVVCYILMVVMGICDWILF